MDRYFWCRVCLVHIIRFEDEKMNSRCNSCHGKMVEISAQEFNDALELPDDD